MPFVVNRRCQWLPADTPDLLSNANAPNKDHNEIQNIVSSDLVVHFVVNRRCQWLPADIPDLLSNSNAPTRNQAPSTKDAERATSTKKGAS